MPRQLSQMILNQLYRDRLEGHRPRSGVRWAAAAITCFGMATAPASPAATDELADVLMVDMRIPKPLSGAEGRGLKPGDQFQECSGCPEMIVVPAGEFTMGSPEREEGRSEDESPQHKVSFRSSFAVGRFAITFQEWDACVADHGCRNHLPGDKGWGRGHQPIINSSAMYQLSSRPHSRW
jgi:formylglycine-generating enzyme required for sulfatase activity